MRIVARPKALVVVLVLASLSGVAAAQDSAPLDGAIAQLASPQSCTAFDESREAEDARVVEAALAAFERGGFRALDAHIAPLTNVLDHAPDCFPAVELRGDRLIARVDLDPSLTLAALTSAVARERSMSLIEGVNIYPLAAFMIGSWHQEFGRPEETLTWLDRGLALQPHDQYLAVEKATALATLHRPAEAVALLQSVLDDPLAAAVSDRARLLRNLGVSLIDIDRLDDAEAALNESIRLQPNSPGARSELLYIARLRAGAPPTPLVPVSPRSEAPKN